MKRIRGSGSQFNVNPVNPGDRENNIDKTRFFLSKQIKKTGSLKKNKDFSLEFLTKFKKYSY